MKLAERNPVLYAKLVAEAEELGVSVGRRCREKLRAIMQRRIEKLGILADLQEQPPSRIRAHGSWHQLGAALDALAMAQDIAHAARTHRDWHGGRVRGALNGD
jgi:hypothetical protein